MHSEKDFQIVYPMTVIQIGAFTVNKLTKLFILVQGNFSYYELTIFVIPPFELKSINPNEITAVYTIATKGSN